MKTELLSPAGSIKAMKYAFAYGAGAVYAGQPRYSLRVRNNEFNHENLPDAIKYAHNLGKKFYMVVNIAPHNDKLKTFVTDIEKIVEMEPDALIMSDPGLINLVRTNFPEVNIHLSVQANAVNWATVKFWRDQGLTRIILSRELSLKEIEEIKQKVPDIELEVFVHGALCMAYSGRCLLSGYINHRDANQGTCTNACRWSYDVQTAQEDILGDIVAKTDTLSCCSEKQPTLGIGEPSSDVFTITDPKRPENVMTAFEDVHGTYIMNSKDLRAIQYVKNLVEIGVDSLKIEGRTKSHYYVARTAQLYSKAIEDAELGLPFDDKLMLQLEGLANRGYTEGFLQRHKHKEYQNYLIGTSHHGSQQFVGEVIQILGNEKVQIAVKNRFVVGDEVELITPKQTARYILSEIFDKKGSSVNIAPGDGHIVSINLPEKLKNQDLSFGLLMRCMPG